MTKWNNINSARAELTVKSEAGSALEFIISFVCLKTYNTCKMLFLILFTRYQAFVRLMVHSATGKTGQQILSGVLE